MGHARETCLAIFNPAQDRLYEECNDEEKHVETT